MADEKARAETRHGFPMTDRLLDDFDEDDAELQSGASIVESRARDIVLPDEVAPGAGKDAWRKAFDPVKIAAVKTDLELVLSIASGPDGARKARETRADMI